MDHTLFVQSILEKVLSDKFISLQNFHYFWSEYRISTTPLIFVPCTVCISSKVYCIITTSVSSQASIDSGSSSILHNLIILCEVSNDNCHCLFYYKRNIRIGSVLYLIADIIRTSKKHYWISSIHSHTHSGLCIVVQVSFVFEDIYVLGIQVDWEYSGTPNF